MSIKKLKFISPIAIFILCSITHFGYEFMPNIITSFFFPVNESIFEHMKMIYSSVIIWTIIEYFIIKKYNLIANNIWFNGFISGILNIIIFLTIYFPARHILGENMIITFILLFISISITQYISYYILRNKTILNNKISIILIIFMFIFLSLFTYKPIRNYFFYDYQKELYGIPPKN